MNPLSSLRLLVPVLTAALALPAQELPKPGPQHEKLAASAGTWDTVAESIGMDGKPLTDRGVSVKKMALGGFWLIDDFESTWAGMPFHGHGMTGYDPIKQKYVSTWTDSMSPHLMVMEGDYDASGKVLTMTGMGIGMDGQPAMYKMVLTTKDKDTEVFEMYMTPKGGEEMKAITITYTRRKGDKAVEASADKRKPHKEPAKEDGGKE